MVKDMSFELGDDQIKTMTILIGLNTSDFTYGKRISLDLMQFNTVFNRASVIGSA